MKQLSLDENNDLLQEITKKEYEKINNKEKTYKKKSTDTLQEYIYYYKKYTDDQEKNTILNFAIYELLIKIKNIGLFFVILTIISIIASIILALR